MTGRGGGVVVPMTGGANDNAGDDEEDHHDHDDDVFRADPLVPALERGEQDEYFSLGLVVNWPLLNHASNSNNGTEHFDSNTNTVNNNNNNRHQPLQEHYESFCSRVQTECFSQFHNREDDGDDEDIDDDDDEDESKTMFLPLESLHITVATLVSATKISDNDFQHHHQQQQQQQQQEEDEIIRRWKELLVRASQHEDWPKTMELQLKIRGALITKTAGILLWEDRSKGISKIRQCLHSVVNDEVKQKQRRHQQKSFSGTAAAATQHDDNNDNHDLSSSSSSSLCHNGFMDGFRTPDIIHTTFMRYRTPPPSRQSPSEANSILQRNIVCSGVDNDRNGNDNGNGNGNENIPHPFFQHQQRRRANPQSHDDDTTMRATSADNTDTTDTTDTVYIDCVKMVNCKIYLQPPKRFKSKTFHNEKYVVDDGETVTDKPAVAKDENYDDDNDDYHEVYLTLPIGSGSLRE